jgi:putative hydrolase of the HAD superfamily
MRPAVVFDLGSVLVDCHTDLLVQQMQKHCAVLGPELVETALHHPLYHQYETGHISTEQFILQTSKAIGYKGTARDFVRAWNSLLSENLNMIGCFDRIRNAGYKTYVLSNTNPMHLDHMQRHFPFLAKFNGHIYSHEVGFRKPDARIYEAVEKMTGKSGKHIVYIDDLPVNIKAAQERNWTSILQDNHVSTINHLTHTLHLA